MGCGSRNAHSAEIIIRATRTREVLGEKNRWSSRLLCRTELDCQRTAWSLLRRRSRVVQVARRRRRNPCDTNFGLAVRRLCCGGVRFNMRHGLKGCEAMSSGKIAPARQSHEVQRQSSHLCRRAQHPFWRAVKERANRVLCT